MSYSILCNKTGLRLVAIINLVEQTKLVANSKLNTDEYQLSNLAHCFLIH